MSKFPHVQIEHLLVRYRTGPDTAHTAVDGVSVNIRRGETIGIVGESGCGKSTLARTLLGYTRPGAWVAGGHVKIDGANIFDFAPSSLRNFRGRSAAMVPQNPLSSLTPHVTLGQHLTELIAFYGKARGREVRERALDLMAAMGLPEPKALFDRYPHEISGGQRQRVVIAAALVAEPPLVVLDEPTTALDKTVETQVLDLVAGLQRQHGTTLVYVSHDLNVVRRMCRRVLVMHAGKVLEDGAIDDVFSSPRTEYARNLVAAIPRLEATRPLVSAARGRQPRLVVEDLDFSYGRKRGGLAKMLFGAGKRPPLTLTGIDLSLAPGQTVGIVGESGSGKSTLAALVAGLYAGNSGRITLDGTLLSGRAAGRDPDLRRRVQLIFQDPLSSLNPRHTVESLISRPLHIYRNMTRAQARDRCVELLAELDLPTDILSRMPRQLSGGQQQRIAIARAFAAEPDLVLCDEITSALDVTVQAQVLKLMKRLQQERGTSYLFISHDLPVVAQMSDRIMVLERGQIRDYATTTTILTGQTSDYTRRLLGAFDANRTHSTQRTIEHVA
ncbi:MAG: ABC transporter ATP-binding protein [Hyphomicrobiales bacterium]|nr:MAG: ABC transporter ATP-binding protein [Hyphomicrobiales bacterium]